MSSFTDQQPRTATESDVSGRWNGLKNGEGFRCYLCGHRFKVGDYWRWVYSANIASDHRALINFITCARCDGDDVNERWAAANAELDALMCGRFWWYAR